MTALATIFHHVGLITHDMDKTIARYEQLGFFFTPLSLPRIVLKPGMPPEPFGAGNRTAIFEENYLEVLAHTDLSLWNTTMPQQRAHTTSMSRWPATRACTSCTSAPTTWPGCTGG
jgi:hypothetical protein